MAAMQNLPAEQQQQLMQAIEQMQVRDRCAYSLPACNTDRLGTSAHSRCAKSQQLWRCFCAAADAGRRIAARFAVRSLCRLLPESGCAAVHLPASLACWPSTPAALIPSPTLPHRAPFAPGPRLPQPAHVQQPRGALLPRLRERVPEQGPELNRGEGKHKLVPSLGYWPGDGSRRERMGAGREAYHPPAPAAHAAQRPPRPPLLPRCPPRSASSRAPPSS